MFLHMRAAAGDFCDILEQNKHRYDGWTFAHKLSYDDYIVNALICFDTFCDSAISVTPVYRNSSGCSAICLQ